MSSLPKTTQHITSLVKSDGTLELRLAEVALPPLKPGDVLLRIEAAPLNPSDLGLLFGGADMSTAKNGPGSSPASPVVQAQVPANVLRTLKARWDTPMPVGNEAGGVVIAAGSSPEAQALVGRVVGIFGGPTYSKYRVAAAKDCLVVPQGVTPAQAAACFVNPLTVLGMVETMKMEGHKALLHTAAASNLGQMLVKVCNADKIPLVNVVRKPDQAALLRKIGAKYVCDSSSPTFQDDLTKALIETGATIAFDAIGGGKQAGQILTAMEAAANATAKEYSRYGSTTHKQLYIYGGLDRGPTVLNRNFGMAWSIGGWLLMPFMAKIGAAGREKLRKRVADEITTTFASNYTEEVGLAKALDLDVISVYAKQATGQKVLIKPNL